MSTTWIIILSVVGGLILGIAVGFFLLVKIIGSGIDRFGPRM